MHTSIERERERVWVYIVGLGWVWYTSVELFIYFKIEGSTCEFLVMDFLAYFKFTF
jgi:hypothetical protein